LRLSFGDIRVLVNEDYIDYMHPIKCRVKLEGPKYGALDKW
jgi:hypothetical protein